MTRRKTGSENIRKLTKLGNTTLVVSLPIDMIRELKWREKQKVVVEKKGNSLIISDWKK